MRPLKEWHKIVFGVLAVLAMLILADRIIGGLMEAAYRHSRYGIFHRQEYCMHESEDKLLVLGSSRAAHHYVPQILTDSLGLSAYNCGSDGMCIYYSYAVLEAYIHRGAVPEVVICEVMPTDLIPSRVATFTLDAAIDRLAPNYGEVPAIDSMLTLGGWKERLKLKSKLFRYNSKAVQLVKCNFMGEKEDRGYEPLFGLMDVGKLKAESARQSSAVSLEIEEQKRLYLEKLIMTCRLHGIRLYLMYSPYYGHHPGRAVGEIARIAEQDGVSFSDMTSDTDFDDPALFRDEMHLNDAGARLYTSKIISIIRTAYDN